MLNDGKAEARTANLARSSRIHAIESHENAWQMFRWDSDSGVAHADHHAVFPPAREDGDGAGLRVAHRVLDEVLKDLSHGRAVSEHVIGIRRDLGAQSELPPLGFGLYEGEHVGGGDSQIDLDRIRHPAA